MAPPRSSSLERAADVAAGHTATDQVETILYRLASSPSRRALLGMRPRDGRLIRPLLAFTREQTGGYCLERGLSWRDDESNETDTYARGRVRNTLMPALREIHPAAERNVLALASTLRDEADVLDALVDQELRRRLRDRAEAAARAADRSGTVDRAAPGRCGPGAARRPGTARRLRTSWRCGMSAPAPRSAWRRTRDGRGRDAPLHAQPDTADL